MKWIKYSIKTLTSAEDIVISALDDIGIEGVEIEDKIPLSSDDLQGMFVDIMPEIGADNGEAVLSFYLDEDKDEDEIIKNVKEVLKEVSSYCEIGEGTITRDETEDKDWINNWKKYFHQFSVDDIAIVPSWEEPSEENKNKLLIHIDPGTAFGTGMHETTQLVIKQLKKYVKEGMKVLDVGTGSGILGILAIKFGAKTVFATDLDPCTINALKENMEVNNIPEDKITLHIGNIIDNRDLVLEAGINKYDIVTANILADVLIPLTPVIVENLKAGGLYITSGILDNKEEQVKEAIIKSGLKIEEITYQGEWVSITSRKEK